MYYAQKDTKENFKLANQTQHTDLMVVFQEKHYIIIVSSSPYQQTKQKQRLKTITHTAFQLPESLTCYWYSLISIT